MFYVKFKDVVSVELLNFQLNTYTLVFSNRITNIKFMLFIQKVFLVSINIV